MPMLLPLQHASREKYVLGKKRLNDVQADSTVESSHCSPQTKKFFPPSFTQSLLSLVLIIGLLYRGIPEQNQTTTYTYDPRGLPTSVAQSYADASTGPSTLVSRGYDAYGQLTSETTSLNGTPLSSWTQTWDAAGRRSALNWSSDKTIKGGQYNFSYNALGEVTSSQNGSGTCSYAYNDNGLLSQKSTPSGTTTFTRDKNGNIISAILSDVSIESLTYRSDGKIASYAISGTAGNETKNYQYDVSGRVAKEPYLLSQGANNLTSGTQTASYTFDDLNIRLKQEVVSDVANNALEKDSFSRVTLDSLNPNASTPTSWTSSYDSKGNLITHNSDSNNQSLIWDSFGRLVKVTQGANNQSHDWKTIYDGLGRRIQTTSGGDVINYYYDPEVEFLELGHSVNGSRQWNLYGPDRSGIYGGAQGIGGLETCFDEHTKSSFGMVNNYFGDVVGLVSSGTFTPYQSAIGAYGAMPGSSVNQALQPQWRGHYLDPTGFYCMGARYYDPTSGRFISPDPLGHSSSLGLYDYCNGDPVNGLDPDGRCVETIGAAGSIIASAAFGGPAAYQGVNYGTDRLGITDTSSLLNQQQFQYNSQVANLTEGTQGALFAFAGARAPVNRISYEPMRFEVGEGILEEVQPETLTVGGSLREPGVIPPKLYHYTAEENVSGILKHGLRPGTESGQIFTTLKSTLTPLQSQIELGLSPNRGLPGALFKIDAEGLGRAGIRPKFGPVRVQPTPTSPGGGQEIIYEEEIPAQFLRQIR